jgi:phenylpropionate dioxygenase-like ring-hydroxylating dioxygenase large terminal subunit
MVRRPSLVPSWRLRSPSSRGAYRFPFPPFPAGWYTLGEAAAFEPGAAQKVHRFGRDLVVFRTESGAIAVMDAACPHLGADLGGGTVRGEELICPFHGFGFAADGRCASLPDGYGGRIPPKLACHTWPTRVIDGLLLTWFDPAGGPPRWEIPAFDASGWRPRRLQRFEVRTHPQETGEGSVDLGHLRSVHRYLTAEAVGDLEIDGPRLAARYRATRRALPGMGRDVMTFEFAPELHGLGYSTVDVHVFDLDLRYRVWVLATPIDGEHIDYHVGFRMAEPARLDALHPLLGRLPRRLVVPILENATFLAFESDVALDFPIWENKAYVHPPALVAGDGPIGQYRRWARQFYAEAHVEAPRAEVRA